MLNDEQAAVVKGLLARGDKQHDIAAFFGENGGRIAEIATGKRFATVQAAARKDLPTVSAVMSGFAIYAAREALRRAKIGVEAAIVYLDDYEADRDRATPKGRQGGAGGPKVRTARSTGKGGK